MALARMLENNGNSVQIWTRHSEKLDLYASKRIYPPLNDMPIPSGISFEKSLSAICEGKDVLLSAVPSVYVRSIIKDAAFFIAKNQLIVSVTKGIEKDTLLSPTQVIKDELKNVRGAGFSVRIAALSGPSHAEEVARDLPTTIVSSSEDMSLASFVQDIFTSSFMRVYTNSDIRGVELCGALKNIIALACGISQGLGYGDNTKAALITRGLAEITRLGLAMGCRLETFAGLCGLGDLVVTCTSKNSRNNRCGILIGEGLSPEKAKEKVGMAVEGINTLPAAMQLMLRYDVQMPITHAVNAVINLGMPAGEAVNLLMMREKKNEL